MSERLRPRATWPSWPRRRRRRPCTTPRSRSSTRATPASTTTAAARADRRPDRVRAALPPADPPRAGAAGQPGLGRRRGLRPRLPRTPLRAAAPGDPRPAARAGRPDHVAPPRPQTARCGSSTSSRGSSDGRVALLSKSHQILVDGVATVDLGQVLLDVDPAPRELVRRRVAGRRERSPAGLLRGAVRDTVRHPGTVVDTLREQRRTLAALRGQSRARRRSPGRHGLTDRRPGAGVAGQHRARRQQRRFVTVRTSLEDYRKVRRVHGGTVNDVVLATLTGALRTWLMTRAESVHGSGSCGRWCR